MSFSINLLLLKCHPLIGYMLLVAACVRDHFFVFRSVFKEDLDEIFERLVDLCGRRGGHMVSTLDSGASGPGSNPGRG